MIASELKMRRMQRGHYLHQVEKLLRAEFPEDDLPRSTRHELSRLESGSYRGHVPDRWVKYVRVGYGLDDEGEARRLIEAARLQRRAAKDEEEAA